MKQMRIGDTDNFVEMICQAVGIPGLPDAGDMRTKIVVRNRGFAAELHKVWITASDFDCFLAQLRQLDETRRGEATLQEIAKVEFCLQIQTVDRSGHIRV